MIDDIDIDFEIEEEETPKQTQAQQPVQSTQEVTPEAFNPTLFEQQFTPNHGIFKEVEEEERAYDKFTFDADKLMDPNYVPYMKKILEIRRRKINTMDYTEFLKFKPLFDSNNRLSHKELDELFEEWQFRITLYDPVEVYKDGKLIYRIPAVFNRTNTIDVGVDRMTAEHIASGYGNTCVRDEHQVSDKGYFYADQLKQAFIAAQQRDQTLREKREIEATVDSMILTGKLNVPQQKQAPSENKISNNSDTSSDVNKEIEIDESDIEYM